MKVTINKEYTTLAQVEKVKADIKDFKSMYTEKGLLSAFSDATGLVDYFCDVYSCEVEAFPENMLIDSDTVFCVEMVAGVKFSTFYTIRFYCNISCEVDTRDLIDYRGFSTGKKLYSCEAYQFVGK